MFYKIQFKNKLTIQEFKEGFELLSTAFAKANFSQWNSINEEIELAEDGIVDFPKEPITQSVGGIEVRGDYKNRDEFFRSFKKTIIESLDHTKAEVLEVCISDSQVANHQTEWFAIPD